MKSKPCHVDPEPRIITLLRSLRDAHLSRDGCHLAPGVAEKEIDGILDGWQQHENLHELRRSLGVNKVGRGARRKLRTAEREWSIANAIVNAAINGSTRPVAQVADWFQADEREIQRAWEKRGAEMLGSWRRLLDHPQLAEDARTIIERLSPRDQRRGKPRS